jgi:hypothetical protein
MKSIQNSGQFLTLKIHPRDQDLKVIKEMLNYGILALAYNSFILF